MGCASYHHLASEHERLSKRLNQIFKEKESVYDDKILLETEVAQLKRNFYDALNQSESMKKEIDIYQSREFPEIFESSNVGTDEVSEWLEMDLRDGDRMLEILMEVYPPAAPDIKKLQATSEKMTREYSTLADYLAYFHKRYALFHNTWKDIIIAQRIVDNSMQHLKEDLATGIQGVESFLGKRSDALTDLQTEFRRISALPSYQFVSEQRALHKKLQGYRADMSRQKLEEKDVEKQRVVHLFEGEIKRQTQRHKSEIDHLRSSEGVETVVRAEVEEKYAQRVGELQGTVETLQTRLHMMAEELLAATLRLQAEKEEIQTVLTEEIEQRVAETKQMKDLMKHEKAISSIKQSEESGHFKKENELLRRELQTLGNAHREDLERLRKAFEDEDSVLKTQHSAELQRRDLVLAQLKADFLAKGDAQKTVYEEKVSAEREKHQAEMMKLQEEVAELVKELGQREVLWKDEKRSWQGLAEALAAKVDLLDVEAGALVLERTQPEGKATAASSDLSLLDKVNSAKELLGKLPADSTLRTSLEKALNCPLNSLASILSDLSTNSTFHLETEELRSSVESLKLQLAAAKRLEREMRDSQSFPLTPRQESEEQSAALQRHLEDLSHRDAKIKELADGKRQQEAEKQALELKMRLKYTISRMCSYGQFLKRAAVYRWRLAARSPLTLPPTSAISAGHIRAGSAPSIPLNRHFSFPAASATVEQVFAEEKRQLFDSSSLGGLFRAVSRTETPLLSQQTFKLMEDIMERKYEADLSARLRHSRPKPVPVFALEHLKRTIGNQKLAQKTLGQALICLLRHMREGQPYAELFCKILNIGVSDPISLELGVFIVKVRADFTKFSVNYYRELPDSQAAVDLEGGRAFLVDIISYIYDLFEKDPKSGELALKLIKPQDVPIEQYVMFKICHKMAKTGVNAEGTFEIIDTNKTGVIEQEEFKDSLRKVLELWICPEDIQECFASLSNSQPVLRRKGFLEKLNFKQYLQDGLSERFSISRARFLNVLVEVSALRERQIASELFNLLGSDATISQQQFSSVLASVDPGVEAERAEWLWQKAEELSAGSAVSAKSVVRTLLRHRVGEYAESPFCMLQADEGRFDPSLQPLADEGSDNSLTEAETLREGLHSNRLTI